MHVVLNQLRKVHNELIERFGGLPEYITIEMVRELKKGSKELDEINQEINKNNKQREEWRKEIMQELSCEANDRDLAKMKLWKELSLSSAPNERICIFTGKSISLSQLLSAEIEIEHILPRSRTLDDSAANKTVTFASFNRLKNNNPPETLFARPVVWMGQTITYEEMIERADSLKNSKSWRFRTRAMDIFENKTKKIIHKGEMVETELESFAARHLIDTAHIAKLAKKYLAYGCAQGENGVTATSGTLTGMLRKSWGWNTLIAEENAKDRSDHRHHAVDALVIALTTRSMVKRIADASKVAEQQHEKLTACVGRMAHPFKEKREKIQAMVDEIIVSHKPDHGSPAMNGGTKGTTGQLHEDTYYGLTKETPSKKERAVYVVRWKPSEFTARKHIEKIRDKRLRDTLLSYTEGVSEKEIATYMQQFCADHNIRGIRALDEKPKNIMVAVSHSEMKRPYKFMVGGSNYAVDIFAQSSGKKAGKWQSEIIKTFDANQAGFVPAWRSLLDARLIMRLQKDDMVAYEKEGKTMIARIQKIGGNGQIFFLQHNDANGKTSFSMMVEPARERNLRKISVSPSGVVIDPMRLQQVG